MISNVPGTAAGAVTVSCVAEFTVIELAYMPPKATLTSPVKFVPVTVTDVPPIQEPEAGLTPVTVGAATAVNWSADDVPEVP